jgi:trk system potassium uptake protein TrkH
MGSDKRDKLATAAAAPDDAGLPLWYGSTAAGTAAGADDRGADVVRWLFPAYIFVILVGFFLLSSRLTMPGGNTLNPDRAVFTAVNVATLTGFQLNMHPAQFFTTGKVVVLVLTIVGTLFSLIVGGLAVKRILRLTWSDLRVVRAALIVQGIVLMIGAIAAPAGKTLGGITQAAAAFANSGIYVEAPPLPTEMYTHLVLLPLSVLGGLGIVVLIQLFDNLAHKTPLLRHSRVVLQMTAALFLIGFVGCALMEVLDLESVGWRKAQGGYWPALRRLWPKVLTGASITSINARTAGLSVLPVYDFPRTMSFFVMMLMAVGASPGGTGGGLKTTTVYELITAPRRLLRGEGASRTLGIAATWLGVYLIAVGAFQLLLLWADPGLPPDRLLFIVISALSNVGLSHDIISMTKSSLLLVSAAMFLGRIAPLLILWWMADTTRDAELAVG